MDVSLESKSLPSVGNSRKSYLQVTSQKLARGKLVHLHGRRSLALQVLAQVNWKCFKLTKNIEIIKGTHFLSHPVSGAGCEISDQRIRTCLTGQNSGCEISGEGETSVRQNSSPGGMSYATRRKRDRLRVQGRESHVTFFYWESHR